MTEPVWLLAPGGGLGHLVRAMALAEELRAVGTPARIVTNSPFAPALARFTPIPLERLPDQRWTDAVRQRVEAERPRAVVLDSFPLGLRGEWLDPPPKSIRIIHLARRLKLEAYLEAVGASPAAVAERIERVIVAEPLPPEHQSLVDSAGGRVWRTPGRIRRGFDDAPPPPPDLARALAKGGLWLVVHSGPESETRRLISIARAQAQRAGDDPPLAAITPRPPLDAGCPCFDYFPAAALFSRAARIFTGAGYNSVAEMSLWPGRTSAHPFSRRYDDQAGRLAAGWGPPENGATAAAAFIVAGLEG